MLLEDVFSQMLVSDIVFTAKLLQVQGFNREDLLG